MRAFCPYRLVSQVCDVALQPDLLSEHADHVGGEDRVDVGLLGRRRGTSGRRGVRVGGVGVALGGGAAAPTEDGERLAGVRVRRDLPVRH